MHCEPREASVSMADTFSSNPPRDPWRRALGAGGQDPKTIIEMVYRQLRERIVSGAITPNSKLRVEPLRQEFGVSATTVREALARLAAETLVTSESQRGFRAAPISFEDFRQITQLRAILESTAIAESVARGDDEWEASAVAAFHKLTKIERVMKDDPGRHAAEWERRNRDFHQALIGACPNKWLFHLRDILVTQSSRYLRIAVATSTDRRDVHAEHEEILNAALARDATRAAALINQHIRKTLDFVGAAQQRVTLDGDRLAADVVGAAAASGAKPARRRAARRRA
jgi:DNA-binding GntR family transcriptional regulator